MRKRITASFSSVSPEKEREWLDLDKLAEVEVSSEDHHHPIDFALLPGREGGWRATQSGEQSLQLNFDEPRLIRHIRLVFIENEHQRTQEFVLSWSKNGTTFTELVRQQFNFNPPATETESFDVELAGLKALRLRIIPDISGGPSVASLSELRLA